MREFEEGYHEHRTRQIETARFVKILTNTLEPLSNNFTDFRRRYAQCVTGVKEDCLSLLSKFHSGNIIVDKCTITLASLAFEVDFLMYKARFKFYNALLLYGEDADELLGENGHSKIIEMMSRFLPFLCELSTFVQHCYVVATNILQQLYALFTLESTNLPKFSECSMPRMWLCVGDLLSALVILDEVIRSHPLLIEHWRVFSDSMQVVQHNPLKFNVSDNTNLQVLLNKIGKLQLHIFSAQMFEDFFIRCFAYEPLLNSKFIERLKTVIVNALVRWEKLARDDVPDKQRLIVIVCLTIFYYRLISRGVTSLVTPDKTIIRALWNTQKRIHTFHLIGDLLWTPLQFLQKCLTEEVLILGSISRKSILAFESAKVTLLDKQLEALPRELDQAREFVSAWTHELHQQIVEIEISANEGIGKKCACVLKGARIADRIARLTKYILNACLAADRPLTKRSALLIFQLIELISAISVQFNIYWPSILEWTAHARTFYSAKLLSMLETLSAKLASDSSHTNGSLCALRNAVVAMHEAPTRQRIVVCAIALEIANYQKLFCQADLIRVDDLLSRIDALSNIGLLITRVCDRGFLFWHRSLAELYFESVLFDSSWSLENVQLFLDALNQCCSSMILDAARHCEPTAMRRLFQDEIFNFFIEKFLLRLCTEVEVDLRLSCHQRQETNADLMERRIFPKKDYNDKITDDYQRPSAQVTTQMLRYIKLLSRHSDFGDVMCPMELRLGDRILNIRESVTARLESTFYNLTTVALHDSEMYARMRALARQRYNLGALADAHLPYMKVEQGLDLMMIARNIHLFVEQYAYDLIEQVFIERFNNSRALNVVHVEQIVNSVKTHGAGILGTMVHFAYLYLKRKFVVLSHFFFDENIKSRLIKEIRYYRDHIDQLDETYPLSRAESLNEAFRKLGISVDGKSFLDKFRELITHIGNTLGLIRMLRAGALEVHERAAPFIGSLDVDALMEFASSVKGNTEQRDELCVEAAEILANMVRGLNDVFHNTHNFIEKFVSVFGREFRHSSRYAHLRNFFILVPALCINYAEHISACRARLPRQCVNAAADVDFTFVDDGFCFGVAFILRLLNQTFFFDSLNWFDSVRTSVSADVTKAHIAARCAQEARTRDDSLIQALALKLARAENAQRNYAQVEHSLSTALIFFRVKEYGGSNVKDANEPVEQSVNTINETRLVENDINLTAFIENSEDEEDMYLEEFSPI